MKNKNLTNKILIGAFCLGICLMLYPAVANWWNSKVSSRVISNYSDIVANMTEEDYSAEFQKAQDYNKALSKISMPLVNYEQVEGYEETLNVDGSGVIGYIEIPRISQKLPIYHSVSESVLNVGVGHLPGTSLPVGGKGTHTVLSAHRGLPSAKLFTDLDKLQEGDVFMITVLNELYTYEVDQIRIVAPNEINDLQIEKNKDYVTLLTCTPYGINTDRLLVRGHRIDNLDPSAAVLKNEAYELDNLMLAPVIAAPILIVLFVLMLLSDKKSRGRARLERLLKRKKH